MTDENHANSAEPSSPPRSWLDQVTTVFVLLIASTLTSADDPFAKYMRIAAFAFIPSVLIAIFLSTRYGERQRTKNPELWKDAPFASLCIVGAALIALAFAGVLFK